MIVLVKLFESAILGMVGNESLMKVLWKLGEFQKLNGLLVDLYE